MTRLGFLLLALFGLAGFSSQPGRAEPAPVSEVLVVASMHGLHRTSTTYGYDRLYDLVARFRPDLVGVEIRQEDLARPEDYLGRNYPLEMRELARRYGNRAFGFDWLGEDLAGRPVPEDYWREQSPIKRLERELAAETGRDSGRLDTIRAEQNAVIEGATPASLNDGRYDRLTAAYHEELDRLLAGGRYAPLSAFYRERDRRIGENVAAAIAANPGRRFVIVTGADHRGFLVAALEARFGERIRVVPVTDPPA